MGAEITIRRLRNVIKDIGIAFDEYADHNGTLFRLKGDFHCDGVSIRVVDDKLILWVQDGWLDTPPGAGLADVYDEFSREWTKEHPGFSGHLMNPFRESGGAPACKATYSIPSTSHELAELVKYQIIGKDVETALGFCRAIKEYAR